MAEPMIWPTRMNATDALFWLMDRVPEMRSTIGALVILERAPSRDRIHAEFDRLSYELVRMRQRVIEVPFSLAPPEWVEDPHFDLAYHLRTVAIPAPGGIDELLTEMGPLYATAFDRDRPLWEAYVAEGLLGGRGALFIKMHHCLVDGVGGTRLFEALLADRRDAAAGTAVHERDGRSTSFPAVIGRALLYNAEEAVGAAQAMLGSLVDVALKPSSLLADIPRSVKTLTGFGRELAVRRAESPLHTSRSLSRTLSTFEMSLPQIDTARERLGATNNDVILTIVSGAMHRWHTSRGADVKELRAMVPVNLRGGENDNLGNRIGLLAVSLPVGEPNPLHRLRTIQEHMGRIKSDRRARLYPVLARLMMAMPLTLAERLGRQQTARTNFVCTNVPGPRQTCYLGGEVIEKIYPYAPLVGDHPVAVALYSYRDTVFVGLDVDAMAMHDLPHFRDALQESYDEVLNISQRTDTSRSRRSRNAGARRTHHVAE